jgi:hypothetical protein
MFAAGVIDIVSSVRYVLMLNGQSSIDNVIKPAQQMAAL